MKKNFILLSLLFVLLIGFVSAECFDSDGWENYLEKGAVTLTSPSEVLEERGLDSSDGLIVTSSTTAILKFDEEVENVTLGGIYEFLSMGGWGIKINNINYYSEGNESNNIEIFLISISEDFCVDEAILTEYFCLNNDLHFVNQSCDYGCGDGACLASSCTNAGYKCTSAERGCGHYNKKSLNCPGGSEVVCCDEIPSCGDGVCFEHDISGYKETKDNCPEDCGGDESACIDSDGGKNYFVKGTAKEGNNEKTDYCKDGSVLYEMVCSGDDIKTVEYDCEYGCASGACFEEATCIDSDGGKNYFIAGKVAGWENNILITFSDECKNKTLYEVYCDGITLKVEQYVCSNGCVSNACVPCLGCELNDSCYPVNTRKDKKYCSVDKEWIVQSDKEESCENNFECRSNLCISDECVSANLWAKFMRWLGALFGK